MRLVTATIPAGATGLSQGIDLQTTRVVGIVMPAVWTAADLSFQGSLDDVTYIDIYNDSGNEYLIPAAASQGIVLNVPLSFPFIKARSGSTGTPVSQAAARNVILICS